jgi:hypothetical protein
MTLDLTTTVFVFAGMAALVLYVSATLKSHRRDVKGVKDDVDELSHNYLMMVHTVNDIANRRTRNAQRTEETGGTSPAQGEGFGSEYRETSADRRARQARERRKKKRDQEVASDPQAPSQEGRGTVKVKRYRRAMRVVTTKTNRRVPDVP